MRRLGVYVTVARDPTGAVLVQLSEPARLTRLHIHAEAGIDSDQLTVALFESGAAVQSRDADYLISVDWLLRHTRLGPAYPEADWFALLDSAAGAGGYVIAVDAIQARVFGPRPSADDPDCPPIDVRRPL
jgi:hypothetical protein